MFLRVLEYYEGILFLTTNCIGAFDEAFKSRCHMALYYPALSLDQTKAIWESHVDRAHRKLGDSVSIDEEDVVDYAEELWKRQSTDKRLGPVWNGRQIRNGFQSALALARYEAKEGDRVSLKIRYLKRVGDVFSDFSEYLFNAHGRRSDADRMRSNHMRDDFHGKDDAAQFSGLQTSFAANSHPLISSPTMASPQYQAPLQNIGAMTGLTSQPSVSGYPAGV